MEYIFRVKLSLMFEFVVSPGVNNFAEEYFVLGIFLC